MVKKTPNFNSQTGSWRLSVTVNFLLFFAPVSQDFFGKVRVLVAGWYNIPVVSKGANFELDKQNKILMRLRSFKKTTIKELMAQTLLVFAGSFLWNLISGDSATDAIKEAFAVFLIALLGLSVAEAAFRYQTK